MIPFATTSPHLQALEDEAVFILREVAAEFRNPVLMYSVGKDSSVMLHLARKAFFPARPPFPLLHIASGWDFRAVIAHRDQIVAAHGLTLIERGDQGADQGVVTPFDAAPEVYARRKLTEPLRAAFDEFGFDAAIGGGRRDEEKSRAKERIFSHRAKGHVWEPRRQRPELWSNYNTRLGPGETIRVFPLSNWTELDVWRYIEAEKIAIPPLYFAADRPVVARGEALIMPDDDPDDDRAKRWIADPPTIRRVRFRTLGCWPLTGAIPSEATTVAAVIAEIAGSRSSERKGRLVDAAGRGSMEAKKREGYF